MDTADLLDRRMAVMRLISANPATKDCTIGMVWVVTLALLHQKDESTTSQASRSSVLIYTGDGTVTSE